MNAETATLPEQMTDDWIINVLGRMDSDNFNVKATADLVRLYERSGKTISKIVTAVDKSNGQFNIVNYGTVIKNLL